MSMKSLVSLVLPVVLAAALGGCLEQGGGSTVSQGIVSSGASGFRGETGRVVSEREVALRGGSGLSDGTLIGGGVGAAGGAAVGAATSKTVGGAVVGGLLGAVGGAIAGNILDRPNKRGIEVTIQKDDGQQVTIAQADDGSVHTGDRVVIMYDNKGVAKAVRDTGRTD